MPPTNPNESSNLSGERPVFGPEASRAVVGSIAVAVVGASAMATFTHLESNPYFPMVTFLLSSLFIAVIATPRG